LRAHDGPAHLLGRTLRAAAQLSGGRPLRGRARPDHAARADQSRDRPRRPRRPQRARRALAPIAKTSALAGGGVRVTLSVDDTEAVLAWVLGFGSAAVVVEPEAWRESVLR